MTKANRCVCELGMTVRLVFIMLLAFGLSFFFKCKCMGRIRFARGRLEGVRKYILKFLKNDADVPNWWGLFPFFPKLNLQFQNVYK